MTSILKNLILIFMLYVLMFPILYFQTNWAVFNMFIDFPILFLLNILLLLYFLQNEIKKIEYQSILLLVIASLSVLSSFLRLIPLPAGVSLAFLIPVCSGVVFGPSIGFIVGQLSMIVSGVFMGAIGPWLPYQAFLMGFVSYYAGIFFFNTNPRSFFQKWCVAFYVFLASFFFGYFMSITSWPLVMKNADLSWNVVQRIRSYSEFYLITSSLWDFTRAVGNLFVFGFFFFSVCEWMERVKKRLIFFR